MTKDNQIKFLTEENKKLKLLLNEFQNKGENIIHIFPDKSFSFNTNTLEILHHYKPIKID